MVAPSALARARALLSPLGPADALPLAPPAGVDVSPAAYSAYQASSQFISADGRTIRYQTALRAGQPDGTAAAAAVPAVRAAVARVGRSIGATASGISGDAPLASDVGTISGNDLMRIIPIVMIVLALLLAIVLRSLVAPLYLVVSVGLSYLASLGLAVLIFEIIGGQDGINFVLPFFMFIFIMALGQDYNILVMTRIREEAHHAPIKVAVRRAVEATGTTVTSAGLILAGTFGVLTATGNTQVQEIGLGLAAGILLDTFFVRTLLVPSVVVLLGRWNWWPSRLSDEDHSHDPVTPRRRRARGTAARRSQPAVRPLAGVARLSRCRPLRAGPSGSRRWRRRTEYGERAWPAERRPPADRPWSCWSATGRRRPPARCSPAGPPVSTSPTRAGPRPKRWASAWRHWWPQAGGRRWPSTRPRWSGPWRRPGPSPGASGCGSAPSAGSSSASSASGPGPS